MLMRQIFMHTPQLFIHCESTPNSLWHSVGLHKKSVILQKSGAVRNRTYRGVCTYFRKFYVLLGNRKNRLALPPIISANSDSDRLGNNFSMIVVSSP